MHTYIQHISTGKSVILCAVLANSVFSFVRVNTAYSINDVHYLLLIQKSKYVSISATERILIISLHLESSCHPVFCHFTKGICLFGTKSDSKGKTYIYLWLIYSLRRYESRISMKGWVFLIGTCCQQKVNRIFNNGWANCRLIVVYSNWLGICSTFFAFLLVIVFSHWVLNSFFCRLTKSG